VICGAEILVIATNKLREDRMTLFVQGCYAHRAPAQRAQYVRAITAWLDPKI
jgi:G:T-mismatch repair DNA endonuclease (very short patch repair protein)